MSLHDLVKGYISQEFEYIIPDVWSLTFEDINNFKNYPTSMLVELNKKIVELIKSNLLSSEANSLLIEYQVFLLNYINSVDIENPNSRQPT